MPQRLAGQLVDGGDPVADEPVFVVDTGPADESNWSIVATDRSAADGSWSATVPNADAERYHAVAQFEESGTLKNALSKPFLTSQPFVQTGAVNIGFDVLTPSRIDRAIPDSEIDPEYRWIASDLDLSDSDPVTSNWVDRVSGLELAPTGSPTFRSDIAGGQPAVEIDSVDDGFDLVSSLPHFDGAYTIIFVGVKLNSVDDDGTVVDFFDDNGVQIRYRDENGGSPQLFTEPARNFISAPESPTVGNPHIISARWDGSDEEIRINGNGNTASADSLSDNEGDSDHIGYRNSGGQSDRNADFQLLEIQVATSYDATDLSETETNLMDFYDISD